MTSEDRLVPSSGWLSLPLLGAFVVWTVTSGLDSISGWAVFGIAMMAVPLVGVLAGRGEGVAWLAPPIAILAGFLLGTLGLKGILANDGPGLGVLGGVLIGVPLIVAAAVLRWGRDAATLLVVTVAGVVDVLTVYEGLQRLANEGVARTAESLTITAGQVSYDQLGGFGSLLSGNSHVTLPLQSFGDPVFSGLILLALAGAFLAFFVREGPDGKIRAPEPRGLLLPLLLAVVGTLAFELMASVAPTYALLVLAAAVLGVTASILVLARRPRPAPRRERPADEPPSDPTGA